MKKGIERLAAAGVKNYSLTNFDVIAEVAANDGYINSEDIKRLIAFRDNPSMSHGSLRGKTPSLGVPALVSNHRLEKVSRILPSIEANAFLHANSFYMGTHLQLNALQTVASHF